MDQTPATRLSLLQRIRDSSDQAAWDEFVSIYESLIYRIARRRGLQDADAREISQDVLVTVAGAIDRWEPTGEIGSFRAWLFRIARNLAINFLIKQQRHPRGTGDSDMLQWLDEQNSPTTSESAFFDEEYRRQMFRRAAKKIRPMVQGKTWEAFSRTCVDGETIHQVAAELQMTVGTIYAARSRVIARLREAIQIMESDEYKP